MPSDNEYMREYMKAYSMRRRDKVLALLGGVCVVCGTAENLEVDHIDPSLKRFTLAGRWHRKWSEIEAELPNCQLLCEKHHKKKHESKAPCGTAQRYWRGCRCAPCTQANTEHGRQYRKSRVSSSAGRAGDS